MPVIYGIEQPYTYSGQYHSNYYCGSIANVCASNDHPIQIYGTAKEHTHSFKEIKMFKKHEGFVIFIPLHNPSIRIEFVARIDARCPT